MNELAPQTTQPDQSHLGRSRFAPNIIECSIERPIIFGDFIACAASRKLLCRGSIVLLGSRAFDLLMVLLRSRGAIVTKAEIVRQVWPSIIVEDGNLRLQVAMLRKALGAERDRIKTIPGRGYLFVPDANEGAQQFRCKAPESASDICWDSARADNPALVVVGADHEICNALHQLLRSLGLQVAAFSSVQALLQCRRPDSRMKSGPLAAG